MYAILALLFVYHMQSSYALFWIILFEKESIELDLTPFILCLIRKHICYKIYAILASACLHYMCIVFLHSVIFQLYLCLWFESSDEFSLIGSAGCIAKIGDVLGCQIAKQGHGKLTSCFWGGGEGRNKLARYLPRMMKRNPRHEVAFACVEIPLPTVSKCIYNCFFFPFLSTHA